MDYDVAIIGAGMSGLAAGIRLAYFGRRVCILERHYAYGGLNSYYTLEGREFDVGLHAVTNYCPPDRRGAPLNKLLRQLRLSRESLDLRPQHFSEVRFPGASLRFTNDAGVLAGEVARVFPGESERFARLVRRIAGYDDTRTDAPYAATRPILREALGEPLLVEMLLCPIMFYGSAEEHDMDFTQFVTLFKAIYLEGFARPPGGVRTILKTLVRKFREHGGVIRMRTGVRAIDHDERRATALRLDSGEALTAGAILSSAGYEETMRLLTHDDAVRKPEYDNRNQKIDEAAPGRISFVESIAVLNKKPADFGHQATVLFYNDRESFCYAQPDGEVDLRSGIVCCPNNYEGHEGLAEGVFRLTWLAHPRLWMERSREEYDSAKARLREVLMKAGERFLPGFRDHVVFTDMFTPRTIHYYTGHLNGAVYGAPRKRRDGRTHLENLFLCGTDQGYLGIVGAMLSGITMANMHVLADK